MADSLEAELRRSGAPVRTLLWAGLRGLLVTIAPPLLTLVLARWLTPTDFGLVKVAMVVLTLGSCVQTVGLGQALIRQPAAEARELASTVFWIQLMLGGFLCGVMWSVAPLLARMYDAPELIWIVRVTSWRLPLGALVTVPLALAQREFGFREMAWAQLAATVTPLAVAVPLAIEGFGHRSLVWGMLASGVAQASVVWMRIGWRPQLNWRWRDIRPIAPFGLLVTLEGLQVWLLSQADNGIVSLKLGIEAVGIYATGFNLAFYGVNALIESILPIAYNIFSRLHPDLTGVRDSYIRLTRLVFAVTMPVGIGLTLVAPLFVALFFGAEWQSMVLVLQVFGTYAGVAGLWSLNSEVCKALGRPSQMAVAYGGILLYAIPSWMLGASFGLRPFLAACGSVMGIAMWMHLGVVRRLLKVAFAEWWAIASPPLLACIGMALTVELGLWLLGGGVPSVGELVLLVATGATAYGLLLCTLDSAYVVDAAWLLRVMRVGVGR